MQLLGEYWNCFPDRKRIYHHTISSTLLYGLREAIAIFIEQGGLENSWNKHANVTKRLHDALGKRGFELFIIDPKDRCPSVTSVKVPPGKGVDPVKVLAYAMQKYKFEFGGGLGPTVGKIFRIGMMGGNATPELADKTVKILVEAVNASKDPKVSSKL